MTTGCAIRVEVVKQFGKGQEGKLRLRVDKDRPGYVRGASLPGKAGHWAADAIITPTTDGTIDLQLKAPHTHDDTAGAPVADVRPTFLMQKVSEYLASCEDPQSKAQVVANVTGKEKYVVIALDTLVAEGYANSEIRGGRGGSHPKFTYAKAYTDVSDLIPGTSAPTSANLSPGAGSSSAHGTSAPPPSPYGEAEEVPVGTGRRGGTTKSQTSSRPSASDWMYRVVGGEQVEVHRITGEVRTPEASA